MTVPAAPSLRPDLSASALRRARESPLTVAMILLVIVSLFFLALPAVDPAVSRLLYDSTHGFFTGNHAYVELVRDLGRAVEAAFAIAMCLPLVIKVLAPHTPILIAPRISLFVLASLALGPGLIVNGILKAYWGRARPREIVEFGGDATFSPVWWISDQCPRNCSFVSGEAAAAFWLVALVFIVPGPWRRMTVIGTLIFAVLVSATRLAAGGHFLSDILIAWVLVLVVLIGLQRLVLQGLPPRFDRVAEDALGRIGLRLSQMLPISHR